MINMKKRVVLVAILAVMLLLANLSFVAANAPEDQDGKALTQVQELLKQIKTYDFGQSRVSLTDLDALVCSSLQNAELKAQIEKELLSFLQTDASFAGKQFICKELSIIGSKDATPVLAKLLQDEKTADIALYALERIPAPEVDKALLNALDKSTGKVKTGIVNTLGQRKTAQATEKLGKLLADADPMVAQAAAAALGKIGTDKAAELLEKSLQTSTGDLHIRSLDALLLCADNLAVGGNTARAIAIYKNLFASKEAVPVRTAALRGLVVNDKANAVALILSVLKSDDKAHEAAAISMLRELPQNTDFTPIIDHLPALSVPGQVQLLSVFAEMNITAAHDAVVNTTRHSDESVRIAALTALAKLGTADDVVLLAQIAAETKGAEQEAARSSLYLLPGAVIDQTIIEKISLVENKTRVELVKSVGERNIVSSSLTLLKTSTDEDRSVRRDSWRALALVAEPEQVNELLQILVKEQDSGLRKEAEKTIVTVAQKNADTDKQDKPVLDILAKTSDPDIKGSLLQILGKIGNKHSLPILRETLKDKNPDLQAHAIRALSGWPNVEPLDDLLQVAKTSQDETHRILALRGYVDLLKLENKRPDSESIELYLTAMTLAQDVNEKRMVLSGFGTLRSMLAMETVAKYLDDPALQPEAEAAVMSLLRSVRERNSDKMIEILTKIKNITQNDETREFCTMIIDRMKDN
ncbi:MAG TPA: HEAT repeat domain-containing protein [bacterium]|nr:HEAT repeat domain-containing protein [bacterium]HPN45064.1 HEAT repeat domain-containing protein [bacterium]